MLPWLLATASAVVFDPMPALAGLFPGATVQEQNSKRVVTGIQRKGERGLILEEDISFVPMTGGRHLVAFRLQTTKTESTELLSVDTATHELWTVVLGVILLDASGGFVAKPEGFPMEKSVRLACMGDFCDFGFRGEVLPVKDSDAWAVLSWHTGEMETAGAIRPIQLRGDALETHKDHVSGSWGGLTGCGMSIAYSGYTWKAEQLRAGRMATCASEEAAESCAELCADEGFQLGMVASPITLAP